MSKRIAVLWLFLGATLAMAQNKATVQAEDETLPRIVKQTQLVYVPVVVEDKHGKILTGLTKDSFVVEQDGKPQTIAIFERVKTNNKFDERAPAISRGLVENFALNDDSARRSIIVILDTLNTPYLEQSRAKKALITFVEKSLQPDQPVALMVLGSNGLHQIHSITSDPKELIETLKRVENRINRGAKHLESPGPESRGSASAASNPSGMDSSDRQLQGSMEKRVEELTQYVDEVEAHYFQKDAARTTLQALEQLAGCFEGIPGRKSVIWATTGFPFQFVDPQSMNGVDSDFVRDYERAWKHLNDANLALYPVDINGLQTQMVTSRTAPSNSMTGFGGFGGRSPNALPFNLQQQQQTTMLAFASATGGKAFLNNNDIEGSFAKVAQEADGYYLLTYYLRSGEDRPGWHKLKVHVKEKHGDVRARDGFFVGGAKPQEKDRFKELTVALSAPADYTGIHFGIKIPAAGKPDPKLIPAEATGEKRTEMIHVSFPPGALYVDQQNNNVVSADFAVIAIVKDKVVGQTLRTVHFNFKPEELQKVARIGLGFDDVLTVPPGEYEVRVAVHDLYNGKLGTVRTHLVVP